MGRLGSTRQQGHLDGSGGTDQRTLALAEIQQPQWDKLHKPRVDDGRIQHAGDGASAQFHNSINKAA